MAKEVQLTRGHVAIVDDEDFEKVSSIKWCANKSGRRGMKTYAVKGVTINGQFKLMRMHRVILGLPLESDGRVVDHLNGNSLDNRRSNLAIKTQRENMDNAPGWVKKSEEVFL